MKFSFFFGARTKIKSKARTLVIEKGQQNHKTRRKWKDLFKRICAENQGGRAKKRRETEKEGGRKKKVREGESERGSNITLLYRCYWRGHTWPEQQII